jgi:hypothetical protein
MKKSNLMLAVSAISFVLCTATPVFAQSNTDKAPPEEKTVKAEEYLFQHFAIAGHQK